MNWTFLWKFLLGLTLSAYALLVVIVSIGGLKNIKDMLHDLKESR